MPSTPSSIVPSRNQMSIEARWKYGMASEVQGRLLKGQYTYYSNGSTPYYRTSNVWAVTFGVSVGVEFDAVGGVGAAEDPPAPGSFLTRDLRGFVTFAGFGVTFVAETTEADSMTTGAMRRSTCVCSPAWKTIGQKGVVHIVGPPNSPPSHVPANQTPPPIVLMDRFAGIHLRHCLPVFSSGPVYACQGMKLPAATAFVECGMGRVGAALRADAGRGSPSSGTRNWST